MLPTCWVIIELQFKEAGRLLVILINRSLDWIQKQTKQM